MVKYICDCCGKEVNGKKDFEPIAFYTYGWGEHLEFNSKEICKECYRNYMLECGKIFEQLKDRANIS
ncbi:TPA: hypothetical protein N2D10_003154 [Clostridium botulinum]|nr:hypothetical protein [Clostridium botulinum]